MAEQQEQSRVFGKRRENHVLILAKGEKIRHMTIRPWMAALAISTFGLFTTVYLGATAYLVLRDDLVGASMARQARMQHEYEDRIAALRAQVDRITSRQLLDQQVVEDKVEKLLERQTALTDRQGKFGSVLERAENSGLFTGQIPTPITRPQETEQQASLVPATEAFTALLGKTATAEDAPKTPALGYLPANESVADRADRLFSKVTISLKTIEKQQLDHLRTLTEDATTRTRHIEKILKNTGVKLPQKPSAALAEDKDDDSAMGGPFVEPETSDQFETRVASLDLALDKLERARRIARRLPFGNPAPGRQITSGFGNRVDPFFGRLALHAGIDFRQRTGEPIVAPGAGTVIAAGSAGGYGIMVEIDHGNGLTTRFGHMSKLLVKKGDKVSDGETIGLSGSTGRSTGPHVHYEVRRNGRPVDPMRFLNAGLKLQTYID